MWIPGTHNATYGLNITIIREIPNDNNIHTVLIIVKPVVMSVYLYMSLGYTQVMFLLFQLMRRLIFKQRRYIGWT